MLDGGKRADPLADPAPRGAAFQIVGNPNGGSTVELGGEDLFAKGLGVAASDGSVGVATGCKPPASATIVENLADRLSSIGQAVLTFGQGDGRFREVIEALPAAIYTTDAAGRITFYNNAAVTMWGRRPTLGDDQWCGSWKLYWPDGTPLPHDECPMAVALKTGQPVRGVEAVAERPDGTRVPFAPYPTPIFDASGELVGAVNMLVDLTDRRQAEQTAQRLASIVQVLR